MKKLLSAMLAMGIITGCTQIQNSVERLPDNSVLKRIVQLTSNQDSSTAGIPTNITKKQFTDSLIKHLYPQAIYGVDGWQVEDMPIIHLLKDIRTEDGEKRYVAIYQPKININTYLLSFKKQSNNWVLEQQINNESSLLSALETPYDVEIISLGKDKLGFQLQEISWGSGGDSSTLFWVYPVGNTMKIVSGCMSEASRSSTLNIECKAKIRSDMKTSNGFYPIELNYTLNKYDVIESVTGDGIPKGYSWAGGYASKKLGSRKGKVIIEFNKAKQAYTLPATFENALKSNNENSFWNYFSK